MLIIKLIDCYKKTFDNNVTRKIFNSTLKKKETYMKKKII